MPTAEIIAIGTELLLGESQDTNTRYLARKLRDIGVDLYRTTIVGDNPNRIEQVIREALTRSNIIITTGGLGPTVDDPTRQAVASALDVDVEFHQNLWDQIQARFRQYNRQPTSNNMRQAYIPRGATPIENPVGTAPAFRATRDDRLIICLPGVPREMEYLTINDVLPFLVNHFALQGTIKARVLHTSGLGESQVDEMIGDLETSTNPTVGLLAHPGNTDIRIAAKADTESQADSLIAGMETIIRSRLGEHIFGTDQDTLDHTVQTLLIDNGCTLTAVEHGLAGTLLSRFQAMGIPSEQLRSVEQAASLEEFLPMLNAVRSEQAEQISLAIFFQAGKLELQIQSGKETIRKNRSYGGSPQLASDWASTITLDILRRYLLRRSTTKPDS